MKSVRYYLQQVAAHRHEIDQLALEVARALNRFYLEPSSWAVSTKADDSPVTTADHHAHELLCAGLYRLGLNVPVVSEEASAETLQGLCNEPPPVYWLIDPLDGTAGFIKGTGHFAVNIALLYHGVPVAGWIVWPRMGLVCWAIGLDSFDAGAFWFSVPQPDSLETLACVRQRQSVIALMSRTTHPRKQRVIEVLQPHFNAHVMSMGAAVKFCVLFLGYADLYPRLGDTCLWDLAAGQVLLRARGGDILTLDGASLTYDLRQGLLNPVFLAVRDRHFPRLDRLLGALRACHHDDEFNELRT